MLNMPAGLGGRDLSMLGQVALEEESGKATNGLGFAVVDRGPRELLELLTPAQVEKYVMPIVRGEYREAWALTEPGAGSDLAALAATATRDGDEWVLNGEKWFVTSEGDAGFYLVAAVGRRRAGALHRRSRDARPRPSRGRRASSTTRTSTTIPRSCSPTAGCRTRTEVSGGDSGSREWILVERLLIAARCCGAAERLLREATAWAQEREAFGGAIIGNQGVSFPLADSLTELHAARLMTYHAAHAFDTLADRKVVHGKVAMAKLYASEMAGRVADRAVQIFGGRGDMHDHRRGALLP